MTERDPDYAAMPFEQALPYFRARTTLPGPVRLSAEQRAEFDALMDELIRDNASFESARDRLHSLVCRLRSKSEGRTRE